MPPAFLYFDKGNVLLNFDYSRGARQLATVTGVDAQEILHIVYAGDLPRQFELGNISRQQFYEAFCQKTKTQPDFAEFEHAASAIFDCNATVLPIVANLEAAGYRLGVLSNTNESHWQYCCRAFGIIPDAFELTVLSYEVHSMKPDAQIYLAAADRAGVEPKQIFFVDDRRENVEAARELGFDAVQYTSAVELGWALRERGVMSNY
jgi:HAD superfamily hydrolase (TIGR01509 family)